MPISCAFSTMPSILIVHGRSLQCLRRLGDRLGGAELVEIIVAVVDLLVGDRPVEHIFVVALHRIELGGRIRQVGDALRQRKPGDESEPAAPPAARKARRSRNRCSGVARRSGISHPRR